jgi:hypothetical protein
MMLAACRRKNSSSLTPASRGAGSIPASHRIDQTARHNTTIIARSHQRDGIGGVTHHRDDLLHRGWVGR